MQKCFFLLLPAIIAFTTASGDITLPPLISDNMLLQQPQSAVWGKADPGEAVTVKLGEVVAEATADQEGRWRVKLDGLKPGIAGSMAVAGNNTLTIQNVAVGDVWLGSGQSNMVMPVAKDPVAKYYSGILNAEKEIAAANFPAIRMFTVINKGTPAEEVEGQWEVCTPENLPHWSATGYFFARQLHQDLGLPVGMIISAAGSSACQSWTPAEALRAHPELNLFYKGGGSLYKARIKGALNYPIKGVIWYQGEANTGTMQADDSTHYRYLLPTMIESWRKAWGQPDLPFYIVQLANYRANDSEPADSHWAVVREAQRLTALKTPHTGLAVAIDVGMEKDIHPKNKQEVGRRLALIAEAKTYGKAIVYSGPAFDAAKFEGANVKIAFQPGTALDLTTQDSAPIKGFAIAGEDKKFVWAEAKIVPGDSKSKEPIIVLNSPQIAKPVAVRYAWGNNPEVNLVNKAGLPAVPFRTDDWPQNDPTIVVKPAPTPTPSATPSALK